jgi:peptide/nickel transport system permease protein
MPLVLRLTGSVNAKQWLQRCSVAVGIAPPYVLGVVILALFAGWLGWVSAIFDPQRISAWILPTLVLAAYPTAITMRLFENQIAGELGKPYVVRAKAMGFSHRTILLCEVLPNALTAALAALANGLAAFVTGTFFVEVIFGISGLGRLTYEAIGNKDIALLAGLCMVFAIAITAISAGLDLAQLLIDPRLRSRHA